MIELRGTREKKERKYYIEKGITCDPRWYNFLNFRDDMEKGWFKGAHLHRKNREGNYIKNNCEWLSHSQHSLLHAKIRKEEKGNANK